MLRIVLRILKFVNITLELEVPLLDVAEILNSFETFQKSQSLLLNLRFLSLSKIFPQGIFKPREVPLCHDFLSIRLHSLTLLEVFPFLSDFLHPVLLQYLFDVLLLPLLPGSPWLFFCLELRLYREVVFHIYFLLVVRALLDLSEESVVVHALHPTHQLLPLSPLLLRLWGLQTLHYLPNQSFVPILLSFESLVHSQPIEESQVLLRLNPRSR